MQRLGYRLRVVSLAVLLGSFGLYLYGNAQEQQQNVAGALLPVRVKGKWGYINRSGGVVIAPQFDYASPFSSGLALVVTDAKIPYIGYIGESGQVAIKPKYWRVWAFSEGLAPVESCGQYGFIDARGHVVIYPQFVEVAPFSEGLAAVRVSERTEGGQTGELKWGFVDRNGEMVIAPQFDEVTSDEGDCEEFSEGLACVEVGEKIGYIDRDGRVAIRPQFDVASPFAGGVAAVAIGKYSTDNPDSHITSRGDRWGYIDKTGKYIWQPTK